jgi:hypothetical protein
MSNLSQYHRRAKIQVFSGLRFVIFYDGSCVMGMRTYPNEKDELYCIQEFVICGAILDS